MIGFSYFFCSLLVRYSRTFPLRFVFLVLVLFFLDSEISLQIGWAVMMLFLWTRVSDSWPFICASSWRLTLGCLSSTTLGPRSENRQQQRRPKSVFLRSHRFLCFLCFCSCILREKTNILLCFFCWLNLHLNVVEVERDASITNSGGWWCSSRYNGSGARVNVKCGHPD